jgi:hypothetical protein
MIDFDTTIYFGTMIDDWTSPSNPGAHGGVPMSGLTA